MKTVSVKATKTYSVLINKGISNEVGDEIKKVVSPCKAMIVTDDVVSKLYAARVEESLIKSGFEVSVFTFKNGEKSKKLSTVEDIINDLIDKEFTRKDILVALGGGVVGDITGFAASIYLRGIKFVQIPTTFLAAIDSSVGGKTGVDADGGKNLIGSFYQPSLVLVDSEIIEALPDKIFSEGMAEALKYGVICDKKLFDCLKEKNFSLDDVIERCVSIKAEIVNRDEFDRGERQLLNLGHTFGHAMEKLSGYTLSHGAAVGMGMIMAAKVGGELGGKNPESVAQEISVALKAYGLPTESGYTPKEIFSGLKTDKKRFGEEINLVIPFQIGKTEIVKVSTQKLMEILK